MLSFLKDKSFIKCNRVLGIHCYQATGEDPLFHYLELTRKGSKIIVGQNESYQGSLEEFRVRLPKDIPIFLSIEGKGILHKKVTVDPSQSVIHQAMPNANADDFLESHYPGPNDTVFISIARKDQIEELISTFNEYNLPVIGLNISPFLCLNLLNLFSELPIEISTGAYRISCSEDRQYLLDFKKEVNKDSSERYFLGGEYISACFLLPYYHALTYYVPDENELRCLPVTEQQEEYNAKRVFMFSGRGMLIFLFMALMVNFFYFSKYSQQKQMLEGQVSGNGQLLKNLKSLKDELAWKEKFMIQTGIIKNSYMAYYADQIGQTLPDEITLEKMEIHPLLSKVKKQKEIELEPDKIVIDGLAGNNMVLNDWVRILKNKHWIQDVSVVNYTKEENAEAGIFSIEIKLNKEQSI
ncbi:MAG: PilN domain-containing protein [Bacteroidota bacterium]|nr:PilN domain-containing protein [Bacteroidota bacterium]